MLAVFFLIANQFEQQGQQIPEVSTNASNSSTQESDYVDPVDSILDEVNGIDTGRSSLIDPKSTETDLPAALLVEPPTAEQRQVAANKRKSSKKPNYKCGVGYFCVDQDEYIYTEDFIAKIKKVAGSSKKTMKELFHYIADIILHHITCETCLTCYFKTAITGRMAAESTDGETVDTGDTMQAPPLAIQPKPPATSRSASLPIIKPSGSALSQLPHDVLSKAFQAAITETYYARLKKLFEDNYNVIVPELISARVIRLTRTSDDAAHNDDKRSFGSILKEYNGAFDFFDNIDEVKAHCDKFFEAMEKVQSPITFELASKKIKKTINTQLADELYTSTMDQVFTC